MREPFRIQSQYAIALKGAFAVVLGLNVLLPLIAISLGRGRDYAWALMALHVSPLIVRHFDHPVNFQFVYCFAFSIGVVGVIVATLYALITRRTVPSLPIRLSLFTLLYAVVLGVLWILAIRMADA